MLDTRIFPPDYRGKYPHMFPEDLAVWERFLAKFGNLYTGFMYDITVGSPVETPASLIGNYAKSASILSRLRIDAVGLANDSITLFEVKPFVNMSALGQLITYKKHYIDDYKPSLPIHLVLVAAENNLNIAPILELQGINTIIV